MKESEAVRRDIVELIQLRYAIDGASITMQDAEQLMDRLDQEADYLGAYVDTEND